MMVWLWWISAVLARPVLYTGGPILTVDAQDRVVEAMLVDGDRIVAVGDAASVRASLSGRVDEVRLDGRAIVPGFVDAHGHFPGEGVFAAAANLRSPPLGDMVRMDDLVGQLQAHASARRRGRWVVGMGYDDTLLEEGRHPTRDDLDRVSRTRPVAAVHVSGHLTVVNSAGLSALGIDASTPDPEGGRIGRRAGSREPSGVLEEMASEEAQRAFLPGLLASLQMVRLAGVRYAEAGVTTAQSGLTPASLLDSLGLLARLRLVPVRLVAWPDQAAAEAMLDGDYAFPRVSPERLSIGAVKLLADGSIQGYTGHLRAPYATPPGDDPGYRGHARMSAADLADAVTRFHAAGLQIAVHGNGDAAIDHILDAFDAAQRAVSRPDARHIVLHAQLADRAQLDRMRRLGLSPSFFILHLRYWGDRHRGRFLGAERAARLNPAASALAAGLRISLHADVPVVPLNPLELMAVAAERMTRSGHVLGPAERISLTQALRAVTIDAAWQQHLEHDRGSLEPGKLADFVILSRSPLADPERVRVVETVVGGRSIYRAADDSF